MPPSESAVTEMVAHLDVARGRFAAFDQALRDPVPMRGKVTLSCAVQCLHVVRAMFLPPMSAVAFR